MKITEIILNLVGTFLELQGIILIRFAIVIIYFIENNWIEHMVSSLFPRIYVEESTEQFSIAGVPDAGVPDAEVSDVEVPDAKVPDVEVPDARVPGARVPGEGVPDTGVPEVDNNIMVSVMFDNVEESIELENNEYDDEYEWFERMERMSLIGNNELMDSIISGKDINVVRDLIDSKKIDINAQNDNGYTALMLACKVNCIQSVELLLKNNANIEFYSKSSFYQTALDIAVEYYDRSIIVDMLLNYCVDKSLKIRQYALFLSMSTYDKDIFLKLLSTDVDINHAYHYSARHDYGELSFNEKKYETLLTIAIHYSDRTKVNYLLKRGASLTIDKQPPLITAAKEKKFYIMTDILKYMVDNNMNPYNSPIGDSINYLMDSMKYTRSCFGINRRSYKLAVAELNFAKRFSLLQLKDGVDLNIPSHNNHITRCLFDDYAIREILSFIYVKDDHMYFNNFDDYDSENDNNLVSYY